MAALPRHARPRRDGGLDGGVPSLASSPRGQSSGGSLTGCLRGSGVDPRPGGGAFSCSGRLVMERVDSCIEESSQEQEE